MKYVPAATIRTIRTKSQSNARKIFKKFFGVRSGNLTSRERARLFIEKSFWAAVYLSGTVLVALTCYNLYIEYQQYPTSVSIAPVHSSTMSLPNTTICLPIFHTSELFEYLTRNRNEYWYGSTYGYGYGYESMEYLNRNSDWKTENEDLYESADMSKYFIDELELFLTKHTSWQEATQSEWPATVIYVAQIYLSIIYETESLQGYAKNQLYDMISQNYADNTSKAIVDVFIPKMVEWKVTLGELKDTFALKFTEFYPLNVTAVSMNGIQIQSLENVSKEVIYITKHQVCYKLNLGDIILSKTTSIKIGIDNTKLEYETTGWIPGLGWYTGLTAGREPVTIDISGKARAGNIAHEFDNMYTAHFFEDTQLLINPSVKYISKPTANGKLQCSKEETIEVCRARHRDETIKNRCNCSVSTLPTQAASSGCAIGQYEKKCLLDFTGAEDADISGKCLDSCIRWQYDVHKTSRSRVLSEPLDHGTSIASIEITASTNDYLLLEEVTAWTTERIIGVIGGALGFWLGLDIIVIVFAVLTVPVLHIFSRYFSKEVGGKETTKISFDSTTNNNIRLLCNGLTLRIVIDQLQRRFKSANELNLAKWTVQKLIWSILFFIGTILTIKQFIELCTDFSRGSTQSILTVMFNETMTLPPVTLCMTVPPGNDIVFDPYHLYTSFNQSIADDYVNRANLNRTIFLGKGQKQSWPEEFTFMVYIYLAVQFQITQGTYKSMNQTLDFHHSDSVRNLTLRWSATDVELKERFSIEIMKLKGITMHCNNAADNTSLFMIPLVSIESSTLTIHHSTSVCLHLPIENLDFRGPNDNCLIKVGYKGHWVYTNYYLTINEATALNYAPDLRFNIDYKMWYNYTVALTYSTVYQSDPTITKCFTEPSLLVCLTNCRNALVEKMCGDCLITLKNMTIHINTSHYTWSEYSNCLNTVASLNATCYECQVSPCKRAMIAKDIILSEPVEDYSPQEMKLFIQKFTYPLVTEHLKITPGEFLATSGGLLGFWLGLDVTFLISIIFTPLMFVINLLLKLKTNNTDSCEQRQATRIIQLATILRVDPASLSRPFLITALFERIFWLVVSFSLGIVTLIMCCDFFLQFRSTSIDSSIETNHKESFTFPSTTICVPLSASELEEPNVDQMTLLEQDKQYISNFSLSKSDFLNYSEPWSPSILRIAREYLILVDAYKTLSYVNLSMVWQDTFQQSNNTVYGFAVILEQQKITLNDILQKFCQELQRLYWIFVNRRVLVNNSFVDKPVVVSNVTFISSSKVCFRLPTDTISFSSPLDRVEFKIDKSLLPNNQCSEQTCVNCPITIDFLGSATGTLVQNFYQNVTFGSKLVSDITVGEEIDMLPVVDGVQRCSDTITPSKCMDDCRRNAVEQQCNCNINEAIDKATDNSTANRNKCSWTKFNSCLPHFFTESATQCIENCLISCKFIRIINNYVDYSAKFAHHVKGDNRNTCKAEYIMSMSAFQYSIFKEKFNWSFWNFIAALGGILGLWLGTDIVRFLDWCFAVANWIFATGTKKPTRKKEDSKSTERRELSGNWKNAARPIVEMQSM